MGKKKKVKNLETILTRAEKLFRKANYPLAKREFEKARKMVKPEDVEKLRDITEKIKICGKEAAGLKAEDLVRRAKKYARKGNPQEALKCFKEAYGISGEDWVREKIDRLLAILHDRDISKAARDAEASGEYLKAADLYEQVFAAQNRDDILFKRARCLVKAGRHKEAISIFRGLDVGDNSSLYDYGFALAKEDRYYECLKVWDNIKSQDSGFTEQKETVRILLKTDLYNRFKEAKDFGRIFDETKYLVNSAGLQGLDGLLEYSKYAWIDELWKEEQYETIADLITGSPTEISNAMVPLYAKTYFKLAEMSDTHLDDLRLFWLNAVYSGVSGKLSSGPEEDEIVRRELIQMAEGLITRHVNGEDGSAEDLLTLWNKEQKLIKDLHALVGNRQDLAHLILTPQLAARFGKSAEVLQLIRENMSFFKNREHYLTAGSYYSLAAQALFHMENGEYEEAIANLPNETNGDEFVDYGVKRVEFAYGLYCLENGGSKLGRYFEGSPSLFEISPGYEKELIEKAMNVYEIHKLTRYKEVLDVIHRIGPSKGIESALSIVMSRWAIEAYNDERINDKTLAITLRKALALDPENEHARGNLNDTKVDLERINLIKALDKHKMNKACKIAAESEYQEVRDDFFAFFRRNLDSLDQMGFGDKEKAFLLRDFYGWCARVDDSHSILYDIDVMLDQLE